MVGSPATVAADTAPFCFTEEHRALRGMLREYFTGPTAWPQLFAELGADEIFAGTTGTAIDLAILAEEAGAALYDGPVVSTAALGPLVAEAESLRTGELTAAATASLTGFGAGTLTAQSGPDGVAVDGTAEPVWDAAATARVVTDTVVDDEPAIVLLGSAPGAPAVAAGLDLSRRFGRLRATATPAAVLCAGDEAAAALRAAHRRVDLVVSAELLGVAQHCLDGTVEYVGQRVQFGRTIGSFQAVKHRLADMLAAVELTRSAVYGAAWSLAGEPGEPGAAGDPQTGIDLAVAAALARQSAADVTRAAIQLHGGIAITFEHWAHRYYRRAHSVLAVTGSAARHRDRLAALVAGGDHDR